MKRFIPLLLIIILALVSCGNEEKKSSPPPEGSFAAIVGAEKANALCLGSMMPPSSASSINNFDIKGGVQFTIGGVKTEEMFAYAESLFNGLKSLGFELYQTKLSPQSGRPQGIEKVDAPKPIDGTDLYDAQYEIIYSKDGRFYVIDLYHYKKAEGIYLAGDTVIQFTDGTEYLA